jgi:hypothetical protein
VSLNDSLPLGENYFSHWGPEDDWRGLSHGLRR